jgi:hypothetical protein
MMQANGGPWKSSLAPSVSAAITTTQRNVSFDATHAKNTHNSLQNAMEDAVGTVHTHGVEPCRSPYIHWILTDHQAHAVSALDIDPHLFDSFIGPGGRRRD